MEQSPVLLNVHREGDEVFVDKPSYFGVVIRFGFQPNAAASHGGGAKVEQCRLLRESRFREGLINVLLPLYRHDTFLHFAVRKIGQFIARFGMLQIESVLPRA